MKTSSGQVSHPTLEAERGVCAAGDARQAEAGARMLEAGGNAVDAAVAAAFTAFVTEQVDCGLGGFARVSVWDPERGRSISFDGYVRAPGRARPDLFEVAEEAGDTYYGHPPTRGERARYGPLAVAVPGAVAALLAAHEALGRLSRREVLAPAIEAADAGPRFTWRDALVIAKLIDHVRADPGAAMALLPGGRVPATPVQTRAGDRLDTRALARTLRLIADEGADAFYKGPIAEALAGRVQRLGGILEARDLARYRARADTEPTARYRDRELTTCFDPIGYEALGILAHAEVGALDPEGFAHRHLFAESLGVAFADAMAHDGDPAFEPVPAHGLRSPAFAAQRRSAMSGERALPRPIAPGDPWPHDGTPRDAAAPAPSASGARQGTSQMVAADRTGMMASIITAVGWDFGSLVYAPEVGCFLNNGMSYFDPRPGRRGSIAPDKMPRFGAPVLVAGRAGQGSIAAAGSGGYRIQTAVLHATSYAIDHRMDPAAAAAMPRVHCQGRETFVSSRVAAAVRARLADAGHDVVELEDDASTWHFGRVCLADRCPRTGRLRASAAPHWLTGVAGA